MIHRLALVGGPPEHRDYRSFEAFPSTMIGFIEFIAERTEHVFHKPVIAETAIVEAFASVDAGIERPTRVGERTFLMKHSHVGHDAVIGNDCNVAPGVIIGGYCEIGHRVKLGINASVRPRVKVGDDVVIGAGAVVVRDIPSGQKWAGNPAGPLHDYVPEADLDLWEEWYEQSRRHREALEEHLADYENLEHHDL